MSFFRTKDGTSIYYESQGRGQPFVFVHEFAGSCHCWAPQVDALVGRVRIVTYNCRGYPPSSVPTESSKYGQDLSVNDLEQLIDHLDLQRVVLVGLSMGGSIALHYAIRNPDRVSRLIVAGTGGGSDNPETFAEQFEAVAARLEEEGPATLAEEYLSTFARIQLKQKQLESWRTLCQQFSELSGLGLAHTIRYAILPRPSIYAMENSLRRLDVPTLVMVGDQDSSVLGPGRFISATAPTAKLEVFSNTGHTINLEEPEAFNSVLLKFVQMA